MFVLTQPHFMFLCFADFAILNTMEYVLLVCRFECFSVYSGWTVVNYIISKNLIKKSTSNRGDLNVLIKLRVRWLKT